MSCIFCNIYHNHTEPLLFKDDKVFVFHDINKASFKQHILVCPIEHSESALDIQDPELITHMQNVGRDVLKKLGTGNKFRFGFHLGESISVNHTHLHCFTLPFTSYIQGQFRYGTLLHSVESVIETITQNQSQNLKPKPKL